MKFPSFFSRLYETEYALKNLFYSIEQHNNIELSQNPNQKIILAMFDVLELIFLYGKMLEIESINTDDLSDLKNEDSFQTLEHLISTDGNILFDTNDNHIIYVFSFKDKIIGGTSPLTLVYSSPNYEEKIHNLLSYETLKPLNERNKDYEIISFTTQIEGKELSEEEIYLGPKLMKEKSEEILAYYLKKEDKISSLLKLKTKQDEAYNELLREYNILHEYNKKTC